MRVPSPEAADRVVHSLLRRPARGERRCGEGGDASRLISLQHATASSVLRDRKSAMTSRSRASNVDHNANIRFCIDMKVALMGSMLS